MVQPPVKRLFENATVSELINDNITCWKEDLIQDIFYEEVKCIKSIPLSPCRREDQLVWFCTKKCLFIVKSAYHLHKTLTDREASEPSQRTRLHDIWKRF